MVVGLSVEMHVIVTLGSAGEEKRSSTVMFVSVVSLLCVLERNPAADAPALTTLVVA